MRRTAPLAALSARTASEAVVVGLRSKLTGADSAEFHVRTAERYAELLGRSKGALMKAGQMLSFVSATPAVPAEFQSIYQAALTRLRDDAPPMAPELARAVLERELGQRAESAFAQFDWEPLAAASIGQVHAARLHDGRAVAVKIQYPGVAEAIEADLKNSELLATFFGLMFGLSSRKASFDLRGMAREMGARITEELDYRLEAANQAEFADIYRGHPFIHVPEVIGELCTDRVLTQELVQGKSWSEALTCEQELRDSWAEAIYRFVYATNLRFCLFNADPHPGNYLFHDDGSVSFLDFGCVKRLAARAGRGDGRGRARVHARRRAGDLASMRGGRVLSVHGPGDPRGSLCVLARALGTVVGGAAVHGHTGVCGQVDRAQVLANRPLGQRLSILHRVARVRGHGPDRAERGVFDRRAARHQLLGIDGGRVLRGRGSADRAGQARSRFLRGSPDGDQPC